MTTNLTAYYLATQLDRARLPKQAERGWRIEQAAALPIRTSGATAARRRAGVLLIAAGQRLLGSAEPTILAADPGRAG